MVRRVSKCVCMQTVGCLKHFPVRCIFLSASFRVSDNLIDSSPYHSYISSFMSSNAAFVTLRGRKSRLFNGFWIALWRLMRVHCRIPTIVGRQCKNSGDQSRRLPLMNSHRSNRSSDQGHWTRDKRMVRVHGLVTRISNARADICASVNNSHIIWMVHS